MKNIFSILIITILTISVKGQQPKENHTNYQTAYVDSVIFYFLKSKNENEVDQLVFENGLKLMANIPVDDNSIKRIQNTAEEFKTAEHFRLYARIEESLYNSLIRTFQYHKAIDLGKELVSRYETSQNADERVIFLDMLQKMRLPFRVSDKLKDGFDYYTSKLKLYSHKNDSAAISICYFVHGGFYRANGLLDLSIYYYKKSIPYLDINDTSIDVGVLGLRGWINNTSVLGTASNEIGDYRNSILYSRAALSRLSLDKKLSKDEDWRYLPYIYENIAYSKIMLNELDSVLYFLDAALNIEVSTSNRPNNVATLYQKKGIYFLKINEPDSSEFYLQLCNKLIDKYAIPAYGLQGVLNPNYYLALLRIRQNRFKDAADLLKNEIPKLVNLRKELINEYNLLAEVYLNLGDVKNAKEGFIQYNALKEQLLSNERNNRQMSFETEQKIADAETTITKLATEKHIATLTRNYLAGIVSLLFIIALFVYNNYRLKKNANVTLEEKNKIISIEKLSIEKEKERSDNLLLNILPVEVAEELKRTGAAKAKAFTQATIMFTDFKDFTKLSEKVSAELLVDEIHTCFSAFDTILQRYKIEKIKTIGDAYMCASGLPVPNYTHAIDMIQAAFEIRNYMLQRKKEKESKGEIPFVVRIGIHTGPVVAGIVGIKKFAYDIWGDAVNIASRMESSSEASKINISGSTYELVKNKFTCTHRGKIEAKNKGLVDMYFVEKASVLV